MPPIFPLIQERGGVEFAEMCRVFNMGVGYVVICGEDEAAEALRLEPSLRRIGSVEEYTGDPRVVIAQ